MALGDRLWEPSRERIKETNMWKFMEFVNRRHGFVLSNYQELYQWSVDHIPQFWADFWDFSSIIH
ncbi:MAG TPA: acetoacetate--CoA ligase, partial [Deltaproteobacteria bacterium]|nr:acetoacetate--CoA ligase [Deltaproteobacteria bacterium]